MTGKYWEESTVGSSSVGTSDATRSIGMISDVGRVRAVDEDSIMATEITINTNSKFSKYRLLVVADGMGGHAKGEEASRIALAAISGTVLPKLLEGDISPTQLLRDGIHKARQDIFRYMDANPESTGMGTTAVSALVADDREIFLANIGDSRAYVISHDEIRRVTRDHSYVQELVDAGSITEEESRTHPKKNVITRAIGTMQEFEPDTMKLALDRDESLLLCCDGVTAHLTDEEIRRTVTNSVCPQEATRKIVDLANERGGSDNISLVILSSESSDVENSEDDLVSS